MNAVLFEELACDNGMRLGLATLNSPETLNGLSLDMCRALSERLASWAADPQVAAVALAGNGEKAFCAGGDLRSLYRSMRGEAGGSPGDGGAYVREFFECEYRLDYAIHAYPKPVLCRGHGLVMGGGMGLMAGASHRVVCPSSRLAMPEIGVGLFPDVGGSWFLNRLPGRSGLFLGLTGAALEPADALFAGLADYLLPEDAWPGLLESLRRQPWHGGPQGGPAAQDPAGRTARAANDRIAHRALSQAAARTDLPPGPLRRNLPRIDALCAGGDLPEIRRGIAALAGDADPWMARAGESLARGAPGSIRLAFVLQRRARLMSLAEALREEYAAALACAAHGDLAEGIRALIVDKDRRPRWQPADPEAAGEAWAARFLLPSWPPGGHPLADLDSHSFPLTPNQGETS